MIYNSLNSYSKDIFDEDRIRYNAGLDNLPDVGYVIDESNTINRKYVLIERSIGYQLLDGDHHEFMMHVIKEMHLTKYELGRALKK